MVDGFGKGLLHTLYGFVVTFFLRLHGSLMFRVLSLAEFLMRVVNHRDFLVVVFLKVFAFLVVIVLERDQLFCECLILFFPVFCVLFHLFPYFFLYIILLGRQDLTLSGESLFFSGNGVQCRLLLGKFFFQSGNLARKAVSLNLKGALLGFCGKYAYH